MTMRGGDRPKNAHKEFFDVSVMPRSMFEPWVARRSVEGRVQDNLRRHKTGGFDAYRPRDLRRRDPVARRRTNGKSPLTRRKPQAFLRQVVREQPLGEGIVLDPFAGSGSSSRPPTPSITRRSA
jgi:site-specific DNA-methyltransferase (adenine-specific)